MFFSKKILFIFYKNFFFFYKSNFIFFKKRFLLIKYWKNLKRKLFKMFNKFFFKNFFFKNFFKNELFFKNFSTIKYSLLFLKFLKKKFFFFKKKSFYTIFLKKFNSLKKIFKYNISIVIGSSIKNSFYKQFFKIFIKINNINFFYLYFYQIKNIIFKATFFFHWHNLIQYIKIYGIFINGVLTNNLNFFINPNCLQTLQFTWSWSFYFYYILWYRYYKILRKKIKHVKWLFFFRKYVQNKNIKVLPQWVVNNKYFLWRIPFFLEVNLTILTIFILPLYNVNLSFFFIKFVNVYHHRLYLWKYII